ncbi:MAG: DUF58 domain-containing protein [Dorea sp.]|nr:DUF58 domain-containing protein [Dorea sp.]
MAGRVLGYVLAVVLGIYLFFMYDGQIFTGILIMEMLYPVCSFIYLYNISKKVTVQFGRFPSMGEKRKQFRGEVVLKNSSILQSVRFCVRLRVRHHFSKAGLWQKIPGTLAPSDRLIQTVTMESQYAGMLECELESLVLYDLLGIFRRKIPLHDKRSVGIMPPFELIPMEITRRTREFLADADEYSTQKHGDDPDEIYQVREYRPPDPVHSIHWKLSAKEDELMVKEHGFPLGCVVLLWIHMPDTETDSARFDRLLEKAASISVTLLEENCIHMAAWFEEKSGQVIKWKADSAEAVYEWIWRLLSSEPFSESAPWKICYEDAFRGDHFSSIVVLNGNGTITVNGETQEFLQL